MFRFNKEGHFNIPYGGKSYNDKDFSRKIDSIFEKSVIDLLSRTEVTCKSFDDLSFKADDFVFLDPPYDSEFSDYDQFSFGREEQTSLASTFANLPCPALMIIGKTDFIEKLYKQKQKTVAACVSVQSSSLADDSTLTRASPSARTQASPHGLLPNPRLIYSAIGPSEGYVSPMGPYPGGPHGRKINTCAKGGIGCRRSRSRRQWKHAEDERGKRKKTKKRKKKKKKTTTKRQRREIVRAERLTTHRNYVSVEQRDRGKAAGPSPPRERRQGALPSSGDAVEAIVSPRRPGLA